MIFTFVCCFLVGLGIFLALAVLAVIARALPVIAVIALVGWVALALVGCGDYSRTEQIADATLAEIDARPDLLEAWTIELLPGPQDACGGRGCTIFEWRTIRVFEPSAPELLCHEIVHVYLRDVRGDSDPSHTRQDLFGWQTGACSRVIAAFN